MAGGGYLVYTNFFQYKDKNQPSKYRPRKGPMKPDDSGSSDLGGGDIERF